MQNTEIKTLSDCPSREISSYIDGELSAADEMRLELHMAGCRTCSDDLNLQKSFLIALDCSLDDADKIHLPSNFTTSVIANAESRVSGLRRPTERRNAALICASLVLVLLFALGSTARGTFAASAETGEKFFAVFASIVHFVYDISLGWTIVFRSLATNFVFKSTLGVVFVTTVFILSLFLFSKLLFRFHRT